MSSEHAKHHLFRRIFLLAEQLEPDRTAIWDWLWHTPIDALGNRTAIELAFAGSGEHVIAMLKSALLDHAKQPHRQLPSMQSGGSTP